MMQEFVSEVYSLVEKQMAELHAAAPGEIVGFDAKTGLASVQPKVMYRKPDGSMIAYPTISGVPVVFPRSGSSVIAFPIRKGDSCLLIFADEALDYWMYGKETDTVLKHDLTNAIAIPGLCAASVPAMQEACKDDAIVIASGNNKLKVSESGIVFSGNLIVTGNISAASLSVSGNMNAETVSAGSVSASGDVTGGGVSLSKHTHRGDSGGTTSPPF